MSVYRRSVSNCVSFPCVVYFCLFSPLKDHYAFSICLQLLAALPPDSHRGFAPGPRRGTSIPQIPCFVPPLANFWLRHCLGSVWWCCFRSCWMVLSHVIRGQPGCLLQFTRGGTNRILLASALSSMRIILSRCDKSLDSPEIDHTIAGLSEGPPWLLMSVCPLSIL